ncbi:glycosyltransferase family 90 protein, partial [Tortispora caseinolytica NRRL Y-17796]
YIKKHGRVPPPFFDKWYEFAKERNIIDFTDFDQIYDDLRPFWAIKPSTMRAASRRLNNELGERAEGATYWRLDIFMETLESFIQYLPDMDIVLNLYDEPRILVPFSDIVRFNELELESRYVAPQPINDFATTLKETPDDLYAEDIPFDWIEHNRLPIYDLVYSSCPPNSLITDQSPVEELHERAAERYLSPSGKFVQDLNISKDICTIGPYAKMEHGYLLAPIWGVITRNLVPIFAECKMNVNNDILYPANMYFTTDQRYVILSDDNEVFEQKVNAAVWRGVSSEGDNRKDMWNYFQRHRLINLFNSSRVHEHDPWTYRHFCDSSEPRSSLLPNSTIFCYDDPEDFLEQHTDMGFTDFPWCPAEVCEKERQQYAAKEGMPFKELLDYKYQFDVDGRSFSARFLAFLQSGSLAFKSTIFKEWHDSRLIPWATYIPMDIELDEVFAAFTYFIGIDGVSKARVQLAKSIAKSGQYWASRALRKDDMLAYKFLLLLEYSRLIDDNRKHLGY